MDDLAHYEYTIGLPDGWEDRTELIVVGPIREGSRPTITVKRIPLKAEQTLAQFAEFQRHALGALLDVKSTDIVEEGSTTLAGLDAYQRVYHIRFGGRMLTQRQIYVIRGPMAYVLTVTSTREHFADDAPLFDEVLKRFQFNRPAA